MFWAVERRGRGARALETDDSRAFLAQIASAQTVHAKVRWALKNLGFETLTEIQAAAVPAAAENSDVVIAAETGSGKTLSYLIPIWSNLLERGVGGRDDDDVWGFRVRTLGADVRGEIARGKTRVGSDVQRGGGEEEQDE